MKVESVLKNGEEGSGPTAVIKVGEREGVRMNEEREP
jgi:hypothetical protein